MNVIKRLRFKIFGGGPQVCRVLEKRGAWVVYARIDWGSWIAVTRKEHCTKAGAVLEATNLGYKVVP